MSIQKYVILLNITIYYIKTLDNLYRRTFEIIIIKNYICIFLLYYEFIYQDFHLNYDLNKYEKQIITDYIP